MSGVNTSTSTTIINNGTGGVKPNYMPLLMTVCMMTIPGLAANTLSFYCIIPDIKRKKNLVKSLLLVLCATDFCGCLGVLTLQIVTVLPGVQRSICAMSCFVTVYFPMLSGAIATFMACERCVALRAPYWYQENMLSWRFWAPFLSIVCLITVVCTFPLVGLGDVVRYNTEGNMTVVVCGSFPDGPTKTLKESTFPLAYGVLGLVLVAVNVSVNTAVLKTLHKMRRRIHPPTRKDTSQEFEMTKMLLALSLTYLICWLPLNLHLVLTQLGIEAVYTVEIIAVTLVGLNFVVDPLIYLIMKRNYRQEMRKLFCCHRNEAEGTTTNMRLTTLSSNTHDIQPLPYRTGFEANIE